MQKSTWKLALARVYAKKDKSSHGNTGMLAINTKGDDKDTKVAQFQTDKDKTMERGVNFVGAITKQQISVKIEFTVKQAKATYPIWAELIVLLKAMMDIDEILKVYTIDKGKNWADFSEIPVGEKFTKLLRLHQYHHNNYSKIMVYIILESWLKLNNLQHKSTHYAYLQQKAIYICQDQFKTMKPASPGFQIEIHPTLVRKDALFDNLRELLTITPIPKHPIATD
eukprot:14137908-Ditylum_brightwellii.AAC.1